MDYAKSGKKLPFKLGGVIYHCFSSIGKNDQQRKFHFLGATTSSAYPLINIHTPELLKTFKVRPIIGKGGMYRDTLEAMKEIKCIYLVQIGGASALYSSKVEKIVAVYWEDLEPTYRMVAFTVKDFGPLIVGMDSNGNSLFEKREI